MNRKLDQLINIKKFNKLKQFKVTSYSNKWEIYKYIFKTE